MDLNQLLHGHQIAVMNAAGLDVEGDRDSHFAKVAEYAERIRKLRMLSTNSAPPERREDPPLIIYGTYAGADSESQPENRPDAGESEDVGEGEGGAIEVPAMPELPSGVTTKLVREYRVGNFVYQDLDLALAEHLRQMSSDADGT